MGNMNESFDNKARIFVAAYDEFYSNQIDDVLSENMKQHENSEVISDFEEKSIFDEALDSDRLKEASKEWFDTVLEELGMTPQDFVSTLDEETLIQVLVEFSRESDFSIPEPLFEKMEENRDELNRFLLKETDNIAETIIDDSFEGLSIEATERFKAYSGVLAEWNNADHLHVLLKLLNSIDPKCTETLDVLNECLMEFGTNALPQIIEVINEKLDELSKLEAVIVDYIAQHKDDDEAVKEQQKESEEFRFVESNLLEHRRKEELLTYQISTAAYICKCELHKDEEFFKALKQCFKVFENRQVPAFCLSDYGDWRAIALMRSTIEREGSEMEEEELKSVLAAIVDLGGSLEGLPGFE